MHSMSSRPKKARAGPRQIGDIAPGEFLSGHSGLGNWSVLQTLFSVLRSHDDRLLGCGTVFRTRGGLVLPTALALEQALRWEPVSST
jgi:hypothetical protein